MEKFSSPNPSATLAHLADGQMKSGYVGDDVSFYTHVCYPSVEIARKYFIEKIQKENLTDPVIVETGCSNLVNGMNSTKIWDDFVNEYGGNVLSIDISPEVIQECRPLVSTKTRLVCSDSIAYLKEYQGPSIDFLFLDSFNCDFFQDVGSSLHHLLEFMQVVKWLKDGSLILIDDTPLDKYWLDNALQLPYLSQLPEGNILWTKGKYVLFYLLKYTKSKVICHYYQLLIEYHP